MRARREEVRARREEGRGLPAPRSSLLALVSPLLALVSSLLALPSSLLALPSGYISLEKDGQDGLPFNGSDWIATDYCPAAGDRFECDVTVADVQPNASAAVFGTVREVEPERTFAFYVRQGGDDSTAVAYGDTARGRLFPRDKEVSLSVGPDGASWVWDGGSERLSLMPGFARDGVTPLLIGDANAARFVGDSVPAGTGAAMKLHRFRIWRGGLELVHDYVPCTDKTGRYGVYDAVKETFLPLLPPSGLEIGFTVNGNDIGIRREGVGWAYSNGVLSLTNAMVYVLSGLATNDEVQVEATTDAAKVVLSNAAVFASGRSAIKVAQTNLTVAADQILKAGTTPEELRYVQSYKGEPCVLSAPGVQVTPGVPCGSYETAEAATNALVCAFVVPADPVAKVLVPDTLLKAYLDAFDIAVTDGGSSWALEAVLTPTARTNLFATVTNATRQIPVAAIARLPEVSASTQQPEIVTLTVTTNVTVNGCAPGFYYSLYDGWALTNIVADANATNLNVLCGADAKVTFPEVKKPSEKAGFFKVGVGVTDNVGK